MRKLTVIGLAFVAMLALAAVAVAQVAEPVINVAGSVKPTKGGSKKKPKNALLRTEFTVNQEARKTLSGITYFIPKGVKLSGAGFKYCSATTINTAVSDDSCPKAAKIGSGTSNAVLGPQQTPLDFKVTVYAGGKSEIAIFLEQTSGDQSIAIAFKAPIKKASGKYGQRIDVEIPTAVQSPAPGFFSYVLNVKNTIGGKIGKGKKAKYFSSLIGCSGGKHQLGVQLHYAANDTGPAGDSPIVTDTQSCKK